MLDWPIQPGLTANLIPSGKDHCSWAGTFEVRQTNALPPVPHLSSLPRDNHERPDVYQEIPDGTDVPRVISTHPAPPSSAPRFGWMCTPWHPPPRIFLLARFRSWIGGRFLSLLSRAARKKRRITLRAIHHHASPVSLVVCDAVPCLHRAGRLTAEAFPAESEVSARCLMCSSKMSLRKAAPLPP